MALPPYRARTLAEMFLRGEAFGDRLAFASIAPGAVDPRVRLSYGDLVGSARRIATGLIAAGFKRGDRLALVLRPTPDFLVGLVAAILAGGAAAPINHLFKRRELVSYLSLIEPAAILADQSTVDLVRDAAGGLRRRPLLIMTDEDVRADTSLPLLAAGQPITPCKIGPHETALILHTSGTTGLPKAVVRTHAAYTAFVETWSRYVADSDRTLCFMPLYHQAALVVGWLASFGRAVPYFHIERFTAETYWEIVRRNGITWPIGLPGPTALQVLAQPPDDRDRENGIRWFMDSSRVDVSRRIQDRFAVAVHNGYGSTETTMVTMASPPHMLSRRFDDTKLSSGTVNAPAGWAIRGFSELRVVGADGSPAVPEQVGSLQVRGKAVFKAYFNDPERTAAAFTKDGWFNSGDSAFVDERGCLYVLGRSKDMIRRSGENIAPREIEAVLEELTDISEVAVVGVSDPARGQELRACVVRRPGSRLSAQEVFAHCRKELASFKVPRYVEFWDELPKTQTLKVQKERLLEAVDPVRWTDRYELERRS